MRTVSQLDIRLTEDNEQFFDLFKLLGVGFDDSDLVRNETYEVSRFTLPASAVDVAVDFGGVVTTHFMAIVAKSDVDVKISGSDSMRLRTTPAVEDALVLSRMQEQDQPAIVTWRGSVDSLLFSNPSTTDTATVIVLLVGSAT